MTVQKDKSPSGNTLFDSHRHAISNKTLILQPREQPLMVMKTISFTKLIKSFEGKLISICYYYRLIQCVATVRPYGLAYCFNVSSRFSFLPS